MIDYIKENCLLPPLAEPLYDEDSGTYDLYFDEKECSWFPHPDQELISLPFDTREEATELYKQSVALHNEEVRELEKRKLANKDS
tara:strand:- start:257 stop:511 length:255 start_codon:yes stop_codon:yes gene_type:complete